MKLRLLGLWENLRSSYWFIPGLMALTATLLAVGVPMLDRTLQERRLLASLDLTDAASARAVLSTLAASSITVTGVVFSIAIVALVMASGQFGPRLLRNFIRQNSTQAVLGIFIATFIYSLVVLATVRDAGVDAAFVPHLSIATALGLGVLSFGVLIYFVHSVSRFIQAPRIIEDVSSDLLAIFARVFPARSAADEDWAADEDVTLPDGFVAEAATVPARESGYVQGVDFDGLVETAAEHDLIVEVRRTAGHFVIAGHPLVRAAPEKRVNDDVARAINGRFLTGGQRTSLQDAEFGIDQLVEIAVRALSPGVNDPFTAMNCLDRLGLALSFLVDRRLPLGIHRDGDGNVRVIAPRYTYRELLDSAFDQIRYHARRDRAVTIRLLDVIGKLAERDLPEPYREALLAHADMTWEGICRVLEHEAERAEVERRYVAARRALGAPAADDG